MGNQLNVGHRLQNKTFVIRLPVKTLNECRFCSMSELLARSVDPCDTATLTPGLLQVLLPLLLALAALHGHLEQPPAPHAQPEEQGLQLERTDPNPPKGQRRSPLCSGARLPAKESTCAACPSVRGHPGTTPGTGISL